MNFIINIIISLVLSLQLYYSSSFEFVKNETQEIEFEEKQRAKKVSKDQFLFSFCQENENLYTNFRLLYLLNFDTNNSSFYLFPKKQETRGPPLS